ncbi:tyrosine-type recombinase/integrase [Brevibacterium moorei]|uniref:tyrosine-type recombinase/integrase n=1 Tax=Brevibacterium moorei TaxID=2968457 RepID=UPI00211BF738|nr:site-specific integrase [Brevibacterium sp. 68QC2CO]MCQ9385158.1 site-specific integrase [Brevibacterium sp. 68QC2CO]
MAIDKLPSGRYRVRIKAGGQVVDTKTFDTKRLASRYESARKLELEGGFDPRLGKSTSMSTALGIFLDAREGSVAASTVSTDRRFISALPSSLMGRSVADVSTQELERFVKKYKTSGSRLRAKTTLSAFFTWAKKRGYRQDQPVKEIKIASGQARSMNPWTWDQMEQFAALVDPYRRVVRALAYEGLRWGEARATKVSDIKGDMLHITRSWTEGYDEKDVKQHQERWVPILGAVELDLAMLAKGKAPGDRLFTSPRGRPINSRNLRRDVDWASKAGGRTIHDLRHTAITEWIRHGLPPSTAKEWAGHESLKTTDRYVHAAGMSSAYGRAILDRVTVGVTSVSRLAGDEAEIGELPRISGDLTLALGERCSIP